MAGVSGMIRDAVRDAVLYNVEYFASIPRPGLSARSPRAVALVANARRRVRRVREREADLDDLDSLHPVNSEARHIDPDLRERLAKAIDALPEIYRTTLIMHDMEGYTHTEIASVLGVAEGTCKSRLSAARAQLRTTLADFAKEYES